MTGPTGCSADAAQEPGPLTGVWDVDDGGLYYLRQIGVCVWWFGTTQREIGEGPPSGWANVALGTVEGDVLRLEWADVPLGHILGGGTLVLAIAEGGDQLVKFAETGTGFGGMTWTRHVAEGQPSPAPSGSPEPSPVSPEPSPNASLS
jgi:hypothetical protein